MTASPSSGQFTFGRGGRFSPTAVEQARGPALSPARRAGLHAPNRPPPQGLRHTCVADYPPSTLVVRVIGHTQEHFTSWRRENDPDWIVESDPMKVIGFKRQAIGAVHGWGVGWRPDGRVSAGIESEDNCASWRRRRAGLARCLSNSPAGNELEVMRDRLVETCSIARAVLPLREEAAVSRRPATADDARPTRKYCERPDRRPLAHMSDSAGCVLAVCWTAICKRFTHSCFGDEARVSSRPCASARLCLRAAPLPRTDSCPEVG